MPSQSTNNLLNKVKPLSHLTSYNWSLLTKHYNGRIPTVLGLLDLHKDSSVVAKGLKAAGYYTLSEDSTSFSEVDLYHQCLVT